MQLFNFHLLAFLLPLALFLYFCIIGKAFMVIVRFPGSSLRSWLLAPILGFSLQILIVSIINQAGYPVIQFGRCEAIITAILAIGILAWKRPSFNLRLLAPFLTIALIVLAYTGWPLCKLGLSWLSYCNDDMANYCLAAKRSLYHGFFQVPTVAELTGGDYSQCYWFLYVRNFSRYGSELLLASVSAVSEENPLLIFMSTIIALGMTIPLGVAALVRASHSRYKVMVLASLLISLSPLFLLGIFYQLVAQMAGIALLCAAAALLMQDNMPWKRRFLMREALVLGTLEAAFSITYPEITPFLGLGFLFWIVIKSIHTKRFFVRPLILGCCGGLVALVWVRYNLFVYVVTLCLQINHGTSTLLESDALFPYFLVPSGMPALFGFSALADQFKTVEGYCYLSLSIVMLILWMIIVIHSLRKGRGTGSIAAVMIGMGGWLFYQRVGFGLFKLAMLIQPFIAIELALLVCSWRLLPSLIAFGIYCGLQIPTGIFYGISSLGLPNSRFVEVTGISGSQLTIEDIDSKTSLSLKNSHIVIEKFLACLIKQPDQSLNIIRPFKDIVGSTNLPFENFIKQFHPYAKNIFLEEGLLAEYHALLNQQQLLGTTVVQSQKDLSPDRVVIRSFDEAEPFNRFLSLIERKKKPHFFEPEKIYPNEIYLSFIHSVEGNHYYNLSDSKKKISFYQKQKDFYSSNQSIAGIGRYFLFEVRPPSQELYLRVAVTRSILGDEKTKLFEHAVVKGTHNVAADFKGEGAANLFIGPVTPVVLHGANYLALDFGEDGQLLSKNNNGIMSLFRKNQRVDPRYLVGYARDISAITVDQYHTMVRPREISSFPKDLAEATTLEFSGWYEDGWISQRSYVVLAPKKEGDNLVIKGMIPEAAKFLTGGQKITVLVNGVSICEQKELRTGLFTLSLHLPDNKNKGLSTKIDIAFSSIEKLPDPDNRPVSAQISYLGFAHH
jgi:hypothetical protein